jgi:hypothetical protein
LDEGKLLATLLDVLVLYSQNLDKRYVKLEDLDYGSNRKFLASEKQFILTFSFLVLQA